MPTGRWWFSVSEEGTAMTAPRYRLHPLAVPKSYTFFSSCQLAKGERWVSHIGVGKDLVDSVSEGFN